MAALVATAWQAQREMDLGVLQRCGTRASRMHLVPELPALPAQRITSSCRSSSGGPFGDLSKTVFDSGPWGWSLSGIRRGRVPAALPLSTKRGARWGEEGNVHPRSCSVTELLPGSLSRPLSPFFLTPGADVGRAKHLGWPLKEISQSLRWRPASEAWRSPQPGWVLAAFPPFPSPAGPPGLPSLPSSQRGPQPGTARRCLMASPKADGFPAQESSVTAEGERPLSAIWFPLAAL